MTQTTLRSALISVTDKTHLVEFAQGLQAMAVHIVSTGGTAELLQQHNIAVTQIAEHTGFPEIMNGRVKTLHPKIYGGILARRDQDLAVAEKHAIEMIDLVVVNLYPFQQVTADENCTLAAAIENIDIGGPTLIRAAAKNYRDVTVIVDPADYAQVLLAMQQGQLTEALRFKLAQKAFAYIANYDVTIARYFQQKNAESFPTEYMLSLQKKCDLRYGENPHQAAAFYLAPTAEKITIATAQQLQGKELSFNNIIDADTALACVKTFAMPAGVIVKHANPCGVAVAADVLTAYQRAYACDSTSAFGGVVAFNRPLDVATANVMLAQQFVEVIIAPGITAEVLSLFTQKTNVRVLTHAVHEYATSAFAELDYRSVQGGLLIQQADALMLEKKSLRCVTRRKPTATEESDLLFAWQVAQFVKSNAIVLARDLATIGIGAGQSSRVYSTKIALMKATDAGLTTQDSVMASDAFFPFRDSIDAVVAAGVTAIIQPGGSLRDAEVIAAADAANIAMLFTGIRHFRH